MHVSAVIASYYTILHRNSRDVEIETIFYPDGKPIKSARILATVGGRPKRWYSHAELLECVGGREELVWFQFPGSW